MSVAPNIIPRPEDDVCWRNFLEVLRCFRALSVELSPAGVEKPTVTGTILMWDGSRWSLVTPGTVGQTLTINASGIPEWQ